MARAPRPQKPPASEIVARVGVAVATGNYRILPHARQRCIERDVAAADIENALEAGHRVPARDRFDELNAPGATALRARRSMATPCVSSWLLMIDC